MSSNTSPSDRAATAATLQADLHSARVNLEQLESEYAELLANHDVIQEDRDSTRQLVEEARKYVADAEAAIARFEAGDYGVCAVCGSAIPAERLEALPETTTCVACA